MIASALLLNSVSVGIATLVGAAIVSGAANWLALGQWRHTAGQHWTARARALHSARAASGINSALIVVGAFIVGARFSDSDSFPWWVAAGAVLGAVAGCHPLQRAIFPGRTVRAWIAAVAVQLSLRAIPLGLFLVCVLGMPRDFGLATWLIAGGWIALQCAFAFGLWLRLLRFLHLLLPPSSRLARIVAETSQRTGIPVRAVWELPGAGSQAMAFVTTRTLIFTRPLLDWLSDAELEAICRHELAHFTEPKSVLRLRLLGLLSPAPMLFALPVALRFGPGALFLLAGVVILFPFAFLRVRRRMEQRADRIATLATADPAVYAQALEKIYQANQVPAVLRRRGVHPDLFDRMLAAGVTPAYPRPAKPDRGHWTSAALLTLLIVALALGWWS